MIRKRNMRSKFMLWFVSIMVMGAIIDVSAQVSSLTCLVGLSCNPNPVTDIGNITLEPANVSELGGVYAGNCSGTDKASGINVNGSLYCSTDLTSAGVGIVQISLGAGLVANESPILTNATLYLQNAAQSVLGGILLGTNCSASSYFDGWNSNYSPRCTAEVGDISDVTASTGLSGGGTSGAVSLYLNNATSSTIGGIIIGNCSIGSFVNGFNTTNGVTCATPSSGGETFQLVDRVISSKTKTNVGTSWVDVYSTALDPEDTLMNTTGMTDFRLLITVDYVGTGTHSVNLNQTASNVNGLWQFNFTGDCDPCDSGWKTLPVWASSVEVFMESKIVSTTAGDDPVFRGYQLWLR